MTAPALPSARPVVRSTISVLARPVGVRALATAGATIVVGLLLLLPVGAAVQVVLTAQLDDRTPTQAIVVLDPARYWGASEPVLSARLEHAAGLYREGVAPVVIVTGPRRVESDQRAQLVAYGVPAQDVVAFTTGSDTVGTLQVVAGAMRDLGWSAATIVTDPAQAARAQSTAGALGLDAHLSPTRSGPGTGLTSEYVGRESVALLRFYLLTRWAVPQVIR